MRCFSHYGGVGDDESYRVALIDAARPALQKQVRGGRVCPSCRPPPLRRVFRAMVLAGSSWLRRGLSVIDGIGLCDRWDRLMMRVLLIVNSQRYLHERTSLRVFGSLREYVCLV